jgi:hypothetical protein
MRVLRAVLACIDIGYMLTSMSPAAACAPTQILVREKSKPWYHFLTTTCAIIGGVFTMAGILDAIFYSAIKVIKKVNLGKQT